MGKRRVEEKLEIKIGNFNILEAEELVEKATETFLSSSSAILNFFIEEDLYLKVGCVYAKLHPLVEPNQLPFVRKIAIEMLERSKMI